MRKPRMLSRTALRPWRDGAFRLLATALAIAAFALSSVLLLRSELNERFDQRTAEVLGGQLVLDGSRAPDNTQSERLEPLRTVTAVEFRTVLVRDEQTLLVSARAVTPPYPLFGEVTLARERFGAEITREHGPPPGEAWLAGQALDRLGLEVGDTVTVGQKALEVSAVLKREPDGGAGFYSMSPRLLMHHDDLEATGIIAEGTRLDHETLIAGPPERINRIRPELEESLRPDQELEGVDDAAEETLSPLRQLTLWISLSVMLVALLCGAAIFLTSGERVQRHARHAALMRCFGASRRQVLDDLLGREAVAVLPASLAGTGLGVVLVAAIRRQMDWQDAWAADPAVWALALLAPLVLWASFALPRLLRLLRTPAGEVLRSGGNHSRPTLELGAALAGPVVLAALLTESWRDLGLLLGVLVLLGTVLPALFWPGLRWLERRSARWPLSLRLALRRLSRRPMLTLPLLAALSLAIATLTLAGQTGTRLIDDWRGQLPEKAANYFVFNLLEEDKPVLRDWLDRNEGEPAPLYPIVRGRLTHIDGTPIREAVTKEKRDSEEALNRDLALTTADQVPDSNRILKGQWWSADAPPGRVSVEADIAASLDIAPGDSVTFVTSRDEVTGTVTSIREVDWASFEPNFYFMFSPGSLAEQDATWLTSFWLPDGSGRRLSQLLEQMPHVTLLDVDALLERASQIARQASGAAFLLAFLLMGSALLVLGAALLAGQSQRGLDNALLRILGARRALVRRVQLLEFVLLGTGSALAATALVLAALWPLGQRLFDGALPLSAWQALPLAAIALITVLGTLLSRRSLARPPLALLKAG
jgi:putative ABC transport system permease protein